MRIAALFHLLVQFVKNRGGNFASIFAIIAPMFLAAAGGAVDLVVFNRQESKMQDAADAAVLAATREAMLKNWQQTDVSQIAKVYATAALQDQGLSSTAVFDINTIADPANKTVSLTLSMDQHRYFVLGYFKSNPQILVSAKARLSSETPVCMIALEGAAPKAVNLYDEAKVAANGCAIYSNSANKDGLYVAQTASMKSAFSCTSGGFGSGVSVFSPAPTVDCRPIADPLAERPAPAAGSCDYNNLAFKKVTATIDPGVYCGGLLVDNKANVTMKPGVYVIKGGVLRTRNSGSLVGDGVTIYFTGADGTLQIDGTSTVNLTAPVSGPTAGMLMMQDPAMPLTTFEISAKKAAELLGTIYLPNGHLVMKAPGSLAEESAFTVVVARSFELGALTLMNFNSDYGSTPVPVPAGLGPSQRIMLAE